MQHIDKHPPGNFCWVELATTDQPAAKHFYHTLFGWKHNDLLVSPNWVYTIFQVDGHPVSAAYTLHHDELSKGVPPHWRLYVGVESADNLAERAQSHGATVITPPCDVREAGRMAVIRDPAGAEIGLWQPGERVGTEVTGVAGVPCWASLFTSDLGAAREFYSALFGWKLVMSRKEGCLHVTNGSEYIGGILAAGSLGPAVPPHWLSYFSVSDCGEAAATALRNGAISCSPTTVLEDVGSIARVKDPEGADFGILQVLPGGVAGVR